MSGSEFERENIVTDALSAAPASKPAEPPREHTFRPPAEGLYDLSLEKDSCGVGFIANIKGRKSRQIVSDAISILCNLEHRGAVGADPRAGDGAGILVQIPHSFFARKAAEIGFQLPEPGEYAIGALFMPRETAWRNVIKSIVADQIKAEGLMLLGWRDVPTDNSSLGETVKPTEPSHMQVFIARNGAAKTDDDFERRLYILRKSISQAIYQRRDRGLAGYYPVSMSCRTVIYKGMFLADQLGKYYPDLHEPDFESALALVHQRFSTNTFPTWSLAHPYRMIAHNGEINTLRGNVNWMAARQASVQLRTLRQGHQPALADLLRRPVRHRLLRQRARIPGAGRLLAAARRHDDDSGSLGRQSADGRAAPRLLRISRRADGAVGRPGRDRVHRRPPDRRHARPQRAAAGALSRDPRRPHRHGVRNGRAENPRGRDRHQVAAAARQDAAGRPRTGPPHSGRRDQGGAGREAIPIANGSTAPRSCWRNCRTRRPRACARTCRCSIASRRSAIPRKTSTS